MPALAADAFNASRLIVSGLNAGEAPRPHAMAGSRQGEKRLEPDNQTNSKGQRGQNRKAGRDARPCMGVALDAGMNQSIRSLASKYLRA